MSQAIEPDFECPDCGSTQYVFVAMRGHSARLECEICRTTYHVRADEVPREEWDESNYRRYR